MLWDTGIQPYLFGAVPHPSLPETDSLETVGPRDQILGLPVHQGLDLKDVEFIAEAAASTLDRV
jgi:hypothetical protein